MEERVNILLLLTRMSIYGCIKEIYGGIDGASGAAFNQYVAQLFQK